MVLGFLVAQMVKNLQCRRPGFDPCLPAFFTTESIFQSSPGWCSGQISRQCPEQFPEAQESGDRARTFEVLEIWIWHHRCFIDVLQDASTATCGWCVRACEVASVADSFRGVLMLCGKAPA